MLLMMNDRNIDQDADDDDADADHGDDDDDDDDNADDDGDVNDDLVSQRLTRDQMLETLHEAILSELGCDLKTEKTNQDNVENQPTDKGAFSDCAEITDEKDSTTEKEMIDDSRNAPKQIEKTDAKNLFSCRSYRS